MLLNAQNRTHTPNVPPFPHQTYMKIVTERKRHEMNETLREAGIDEHGNEGEVTIRFWNKDTEDPWSAAYRDTIEEIIPEGTPATDCEIAFAKYFCWINFPRCGVLTVCEGRRR